MPCVYLSNGVGLRLSQIDFPHALSRLTPTTPLSLHRLLILFPSWFFTCLHTQLASILRTRSNVCTVAFAMSPIPCLPNPCLVFLRVSSPSFPQLTEFHSKTVCLAGGLSVVNTQLFLRGYQPGSSRDTHISGMMMGILQAENKLPIILSRESVSRDLMSSSSWISFSLFRSMVPGHVRYYHTFFTNYHLNSYPYFESNQLISSAHRIFFLVLHRSLM